MQITVTRIMIRWRTLALSACVLSSLASTLTAQLRFAGPRNQVPSLAVPPVEVSARELTETELPPMVQDPVLQAQFRPVNPPSNGASAAPRSLAPHLPAPAREMQSPESQSILPSTGGAGAGEVVADGPVFDEVPYTSGASLPDGVWQENWDDAFDPQLMQQEQALIYSSNAWFRRGFWYSQADVVALLRTENELVHISADNSGGGTNVFDLNAPLLSTESVDPTYVPGTRLSIGRFLGQDVINRDYTIEFLYLGLFEYSQEASLTSLSPNGMVDALGPGNHYFTTGVTGLVIGASTPGFGDAKQHDIRYDSDLNDFELNFRILGRPLRDRIALQPNGSWVRNATASHLRSFLIGMRTMSINEMFSLSASFSNPDTSGYSEVKTSNDMFGLQFGGEWVENYTNWSWGARFKGAGLFNWANRRSLIDVTIGGTQRPLRAESIDNENLTAVLEAGMMGTYRIRPNLHARVAYDAMYVQGIATAPQNIGLAETFPRFEVTHDALFHGLSVGFEMLW